MKGTMIMMNFNGSMSKGPVERTGERIDGAIDKVTSQGGAAQKAGEKIDDVVEKVMDKLSGKGPAQKAGEKIDERVKTLKK